MKRFVLISIILFALQVVQAENYLVLKQRGGDKEVVIQEGEMVVIKTTNKRKHRGKLHVVSEQVVRIQNKLILISNIESVGKKNMYISRAAALIVTNGMNMLLFGFNDNLRNGWGEPSDLHKASVPMLSVGIPLLAITRKRKIWNWEVSVEMRED